MDGTKVVDTVKLNDGSTMELARLPDVDENTWSQVKGYIAGNPELARRLQKFAKNPDAIRGWLQTSAIAEHYQAKEGCSGASEQRVRLLESDPELGPVFEDIRKNGMDAAMRYYQDEALMLKINERIGGVPTELEPILKKIDETPLTFHEACKQANMKVVMEYLNKQSPINAQDHKGVTPLGYAIGANRIAVVKLLLDRRANPYSVDSSGNSALHYAAGYGRRELLEYLLKAGTHVNQSNAQGQTPLTVATLNKQTATIEILKQKGAH
mmetsp:Transcript_20648/g.45273  ORF Transcript_20648/g.45273 Transcript_20648/m.45273 type:complete len:268 (+) Transcript_20648:54-857(+)